MRVSVIGEWGAAACTGGSREHDGHVGAESCRRRSSDFAAFLAVFTNCLSFSGKATWRCLLLRFRSRVVVYSLPGISVLQWLALHNGPSFLQMSFQSYGNLLPKSFLEFLIRTLWDIIFVVFRFPFRYLCIVVCVLVFHVATQLYCVIYGRMHSGPLTGNGFLIFRH